MAFTSPLRYPGGKLRIAGFIQAICDCNDLHNCYIEPFAGGASIALNLLLYGTVDKVVLNDKDKSIYAFWYSILFHTDELCSLIQNCPIDIDTWHEQKSIQNNKEYESLLSLGFSTLYLNRTNRSGILSAGVIGGLRQAGIYKMDCRFNKDVIIKKISSIAKFKEHIALYNLDAIDLLDLMRAQSNEHNLFYLDPPYYEKGSCLYMNHYNHSDHERLINYVRAMNANWLVSYDNASAIRSLFKNTPNIEYELNHSAYVNKRGKEIMFFSSLIDVDISRSPICYSLKTNMLP